MNMLLIIAPLWLALCAFFLVIPWRRAAALKNRRVFMETYRVYQARVVRNHCPALWDLSCRQLREQYNISEAYQRLGRP